MSLVGCDRIVRRVSYQLSIEFVVQGIARCIADDLPSPSFQANVPVTMQLLHIARNRIHHLVRIR